MEAFDSRDSRRGVPVMQEIRAYIWLLWVARIAGGFGLFRRKNGEVLWDRRHSDFISDIVYNRYGVGRCSMKLQKCFSDESGSYWL